MQLAQQSPPGGRRRPPLSRTLARSALISAATVAMLILAVLGIGKDLWLGWLLALLAIPMTIGFPTTFAMLICLVAFCLLADLPIWAFWTVCSLTGLLLQTATALVIQRLTEPDTTAEQTEAREAQG